MNKQEINVKVNNILLEKRIASQSDFESRFSNAMKDPTFKQLTTTIRKIETANMSDSKLDENSAKELSTKKLELLNYIKSNNIDLNNYVSCPKCKDTGYINGKKCICRLELERDFLRKASNLPLALRNVTFNDNKLANLSVDQSDYMNALYIKCNGWTEKFDSAQKLIIFLDGDVGVGKTTLAASTANALLNKNYSVYYSTAFDLNNLFIDKQFNRLTDAKEEAYYTAMSSDLLIIDDLGTEIVNSISIDYLFNVIDLRINNMQKTFICTNLTLENFYKKYGERVTSRLTNANYSLATKYIKGNDLRKIKI